MLKNNFSDIMKTSLRFLDFAAKKNKTKKKIKGKCDFRRTMADFPRCSEKRSSLVPYKSACTIPGMTV